MKAHVICVNDCIQAVVIGTLDRAQSELERRQNIHFEHSRYQDFEEYKNILYWHIHTVDVMQ